VAAGWTVNQQLNRIGRVVAGARREVGHDQPLAELDRVASPAGVG
jgi:hypothetical protein